MAARVVTLLAVFALVVSNVGGDDKKKGEPDMEAMMKHAAPGDAHKVFDHFAGKWDYKLKYWMDPSQPPMEMDGKSDVKVIMDGRFLAENIVGKDSAMPFEGRACAGYCNHKKKYWFTWIDSMTTSLMSGEGTWDPKTKTMTWLSEGFDAMAGGNVKTKEVSKINADGTVHKTFYKLEGGKEIKTMELSYTKAK